ncbi:curlin subunit CsgB [Bradyrhizobium sp. 1]|uniref:curlin subunit CsgB n=1 Tax=Bradyrhizobium sp. 1 TaxID=241591 RepID=UPI001FF73B6B|nr:curlin subunit CsgB [Bradyrhizobium sp. 1]MCK1391281.1 curlin subunit CsgB [Bradyrhizobium sp. 1]
MRKLLLASIAVFALSSAAQAANTSTTVQVGIINGSSVSQQGPTNNSASLSQLGIVNSGTAAQGTTSIGLNNGSSMTQVGVQNSSSTAQVAFGSNASQVNQNSFGPPAAQSNSAGLFQFGFFGTNSSTVSQTAH